MNIKARQDGEIVIFELEGHLDFETTLNFQKACETVIEQSEKVRIIFNMERLKFVGSSGINHFIGVMKEFNTLPYRPKLCSVSSEFTRVLRAYQTSRRPFEIFQAENDARQSFLNPPLVEPPRRGRKKKAVSN